MPGVRTQDSPKPAFLKMWFSENVGLDADRSIRLFGLQNAFREHLVCQGRLTKMLARSIYQALVGAEQNLFEWIGGWKE